jgi:hypothetical protein
LCLPFAAANQADFQFGTSTLFEGELALPELRFLAMRRRPMPARAALNTKRERGRPPALPQECLVDLLNLLHDARQRGRSLSATCRYIIANGGVRWIDNKTDKTVAEITNAGTLRTRLIEAENWYLKLKRALETVKHPRAAEFNLPLTLGMTVKRRGKRKTVVLGLPPQRTTRCLIGKKDLHSRAQKVAQ